MKLFNKILGFNKLPEDDKVVMDRRAFLRGMAVTSAGLLVPGAALFLPKEAPILLPEQTIEFGAAFSYIEAGCRDGVGVGKWIEVSGAGEDDGRYEITKVHENDSFGVNFVGMKV